MFIEVWFRRKEKQRDRDAERERGWVGYDKRDDIFVTKKRQTGKTGRETKGWEGGVLNSCIAVIVGARGGGTHVMHECIAVVVLPPTLVVVRGGERVRLFKL